MSQLMACLLCGFEGRDPTVTFAMVRWAKPIDGRTFEALPRCADHQGCRGRVEADGGTWELEDKTTRSTLAVVIDIATVVR